MAHDVLLIHGPNLSQLGTRDPAHYGTATIADIAESVSSTLSAANLRADAFQAESEGELVARLHAARADGTRSIICNFGAYTHTSVAIRDALELCDMPKVEVHLSNVHAREQMRQHSLMSAVVNGSIVGLGAAGYELAAHWVAQSLEAAS